MHHRAEIWKYCGLNIADVCCQGDMKDEFTSLRLQRKEIRLIRILVLISCKIRVILVG